MLTQKPEFAERHRLSENGRLKLAHLLSVQVNSARASGGYGNEDINELSGDLVASEYAANSWEHKLKRSVSEKSIDIANAIERTNSILEKAMRGSKNSPSTRHGCPHDILDVCPSCRKHTQELPLIVNPGRPRRRQSPTFLQHSEIMRKANIENNIKVQYMHTSTYIHT